MKSIEERARTLTINGFYQTSSRLQKSIIEELEETEKNIRADYDEILKETKEVSRKFIDKVESGRARSKETYRELKGLILLIEALEKVKEESTK
jgi:hypothetical protein